MADILDTIILSYKRGYFDYCVKAAQSYLVANGENTKCRKILAASYEKLGDAAKALGEYEICVTHSPYDPINHYNKGAILDSLGRYEAAAESYTEAITLDCNLAVAWNNLGIVLRKLKKNQEAERAFKTAIESDHKYTAPYYNLGNLYNALGRLKEAVPLYNTAIKLRPGDPLPYLNKGNALKELGDDGGAASNYQRAIELDSTLSKAIYNLGVLLFENRKIERATKYFTRDISDNSQTYLLRCYHELDSEIEFHSQLQVLEARGIVNSTIGSLITRFNEKNSEHLDNPFLNDPLNYILKQKLLGRNETINLIDQIKNDRGITEQLGLKKQDLIISGVQTSGNLFDRESTWSTEIEEIIRECIERYIDKHRDSKEGYIKHWPRNYKLVSWLVNLRTGGRIKPHIHENGWLGGALYLQVPDKNEKHEGSFVVSLGDTHEIRSRRSQRVIDVSAGDIVLFPACLLHHTIPFSAPTNRIVIAFDLVR